MAIYVFRCQDCATFEVSVPMTALTPTCPCPHCGAESPRVFTAPALTSVPAGLHRAMDSAAASAESPQVVRSIPAGAPRPRASKGHSHGPPALTARTGAHRGPYPPLPRS